MASRKLSYCPNDTELERPTRQPPMPDFVGLINPETLQTIGGGSLTMEVAQGVGGGGGLVSLDTSSGATSDDEELTLSWSHTCTGANLLVVAVAIRHDLGQVVTGITYNSVAMTLKSSVSNGTDARCEIWYLTSPTTGTNTVEITLDVASRFVAGAVSFASAASLGTAVNATGTSTAATVNASSASGQIVIDVVAARGQTPGAGSSTPVVDAGQTERWNEEATAGGPLPADRIYGAGSTEPGAGTVTMSWTIPVSVPWAILAVPIIP